MQTKEIPLPSILRASDLKYPSYKGKTKRVETMGDYGQASLYYTQNFGWLIATRSIGGRSRSGLAQRTYAARIDSNTGAALPGVYRVGAGPHVLRTVTVYFTTANQTRLAKLAEAYTAGATNAGIVSDRRSSRIAEGQLRRARGERSWLWSS